jgi:hypothetical protein
MVLIIPGDRSHTIVEKELGLIQHPPEQQFHAVSSQQGEQPSLARKAIRRHWPE